MLKMHSSTFNHGQVIIISILKSYFYPVTMRHCRGGQGVRSIIWVILMPNFNYVIYVSLVPHNMLKVTDCPSVCMQLMHTMQLCQTIFLCRAQNLKNHPKSSYYFKSMLRFCHGGTNFELFVIRILKGRVPWKNMITS